ncbi:MAG: invasion associated locus B family protein [Rhizobiales bacterium]|nr:invasion associated locus B family protein [Hyphomicrobiales bacterium]
MQINSVLCRLAATTVLGLLLAAASFDTALAQTKQPAQKQFGPRVNGASQKTAQAAAPAAEVVATHGAWKIQCETLASADGSSDPALKKQCAMIQLAKSEKNPRAFVNIVVQKIKQGDKTNVWMRMFAPIGVYLPQGIALQIDDADIKSAPYVQCLPQICRAQAEIIPETLAKLKKGTSANFIIYEAPGLGVPIKISLEGFSAGLDALDKL